MVDDDRSILQCLAAVTVTSCVGACGVIVVMINYVKISGEAEALVATKHLLLTRLMTVTQLMLKGIGNYSYFVHCESKKGCHPNHGYNFVNSWWICKILSLLQRAINFQQNQC